MFIFITKLSVDVIKNLIICSDYGKSICIVGFQEEPPKLSILAKDYVNTFNSISLFSSFFITLNSELYFLNFDDNNSMFCYEFKPYPYNCDSEDARQQGGSMRISSCIRDEE